MKHKHLFPFIKNNPSKIYFDSAATSLKLKSVIDAEYEFLSKNGSNPHTSDYLHGFDTIEKISKIRVKTQNFINANKSEEIIFTSGTTHSINLIANGISDSISENDEIFLTELEHSANMVPWINLANERNAKIIKMPLDNNFNIDLTWLEKNISNKTKIVTISHITNTIGNKNNVKEIVKKIKKINSKTIIHVDCAQSIAHEKIDVIDWNVDFISWSAHKMFGPFGLGVLWGKYEILNQLKPIFFGGGIIDEINENLSSFFVKDLPYKLEAGTPNVSAIIGFEKAIDFINDFDVKNINLEEIKLKKYFRKKVTQLKLESKFDFYNLKLDTPLVFFNLKGVNPQDISSFFDLKYNISTRSGSACAKRIKGIISESIAVRVSFSFYNTKKDIDVLIKALINVDSFLETIV